MYGNVLVFEKKIFCGCSHLCLDIVCIVCLLFNISIANYKHAYVSLAPNRIPFCAKSIGKV